MWSTDEIMVISDLHLASERGRGLFQADELLVEFLRWVRENFHHCHLLLNGDVFDFLVNKPEETAIDSDEAAAEAALIYDNHQEVFEALSLIANSGEHRLTILGGNHDPETALPAVQEKFGQNLRLPATHSQKPSCSHFPIHWLVNGEGALLRVGEAKVLIEHGDQYDSWNWVDHEALRRVVCLASRSVSYAGVYRPPPGSRLVINRFNRIRGQFPWLQTLQPLSALIIPLALEVILPAVSGDERYRLIKAVREVSSFGLRSAVDSALLGVGDSSEYWAGAGEERQLLREWLARYEREENAWGAGDGGDAWLARAVARLRDLALQRTLKKISSGDTFFDTGAHNRNYNAVARLVDKGADLVVHGHTHSAKVYPVGRGLYLNTGTWGQLTRLPDAGAGEEEWALFIEGLRAGRADSFARPTFVRVSKQPDQTVAALYEWTASGAQEQSAWSFAGGQWRKAENRS